MADTPNLTEQGKRARIGSEKVMADLVQRIERLEAIVQELGKARRDASLFEVDRVERTFDLTPRTAELRKAQR
jgi:hypothetical protein